MLKRVSIIVLLLFLDASIYAQEGKIIAQISSFRNVEGFARITLFNQLDGFPSEYEYGLTSKSIKLDTTFITVEFDSLAYGNYAISVLHDENADEEMNTNFFGVPKEGYGTSNNVNPSLRAPNFEEAKFKLNKPEQKLIIEMFYR